jgi:hypothetical protein
MAGVRGRNRRDSDSPADFSRDNSPSALLEEDEEEEEAESPSVRDESAASRQDSPSMRAEPSASASRHSFGRSLNSRRALRLSGGTPAAALAPQSSTMDSPMATLSVQSPLQRVPTLKELHLADQRRPRPLDVARQPPPSPLLMPLSEASYSSAQSTSVFSTASAPSPFLPSLYTSRSTPGPAPSGIPVHHPMQRGHSLPLKRHRSGRVGDGGDPSMAGVFELPAAFADAASFAHSKPSPPVPHDQRCGLFRTPSTSMEAMTPRSTVSGPSVSPPSVTSAVTTLPSVFSPAPQTSSSAPVPLTPAQPLSPSEILRALQDSSQPFTTLTPEQLSGLDVRTLRMIEEALTARVKAAQEEDAEAWRLAQQGAAASGGEDDTVYDSEDVQMVDDNAGYVGRTVTVGSHQFAPWHPSLAQRFDAAAQAALRIPESPPAHHEQ